MADEEPVLMPLGLRRLGVMVVSGYGRVLSSNFVARGVLERGDVLGADPDGSLEPVEQADRDALDEAILRVRAHRPPFFMSVGLGHAPGRRLTLVVARLSYGAPAEALTVFLRDPRGPVTGAAELLRELSRLNPVEARLPAAVAAGLSLSGAARLLKTALPSGPPEPPDSVA
jgi:hypothetical protein